MSLVKLNLPRTAQIIFNALHNSTDLECLTQDLLAIALPDNRRIDVSWYPEFDPSGTYTITVCEGSWENKETEIRVKEIDEVVARVENLAWTRPVVIYRISQADAGSINYTSGSAGTSFINRDRVHA